MPIKRKRLKSIKYLVGTLPTTLCGWNNSVGCDGIVFNGKFLLQGVPLAGGPQITGSRNWLHQTRYINGPHLISHLCFSLKLDERAYWSITIGPWSLILLVIWNQNRRPSCCYDTISRSLMFERAWWFGNWPLLPLLLCPGRLISRPFTFQVSIFSLPNQ